MFNDYSKLKRISAGILSCHNLSKISQLSANLLQRSNIFWNQIPNWITKHTPCLDLFYHLYKAGHWKFYLTVSGCTNIINDQTSSTVISVVLVAGCAYFLLFIRALGPEIPVSEQARLIIRRNFAKGVMAEKSKTVWMKYTFSVIKIIVL